ncbi:hypothetical protein AAFF_G00152310 [Aldrovandia affinis]|uniref:PHD-type domain-containing protein n=1 Tax=Aldrovandia affinis TaxID=143900 RepID=A0AAD7RNX4_9TELE|nr:hypothetical protein AAFF_G00152310 [Aldrovandia affinis]
MTESSSFGQLLCCLCKKWANYRNLGDLYGPYYPPEYTTRLPKNHTQIRQSLLTTKPPPQPLNQDTSELLTQLAQLPRVPLDPEELWAHEGCIVWASAVFLVNGRLYGLKEALAGARDACCSHCEAVGPTLGCYSKGCTLKYHYLCALEAECFLNEDNFSLRCPKHKVSGNNMRGKDKEETEGSFCGNDKRESRSQEKMNEMSEELG